MNEEIKNRENTVDDTVYKQWKRIALLIKKILRTKFYCQKN